MIRTPKTTILTWTHAARQSCTDQTDPIAQGRQYSALKHGEPLLVLLEMAGRYAEASREFDGVRLADSPLHFTPQAWTALMRGLHGLLHGPGADCMALGLNEDSKDTAACLELWESIVRKAGFEPDEVLLTPRPPAWRTGATIQPLNTLDAIEQARHGMNLPK